MLRKYDSRFYENRESGYNFSLVHTIGRVDKVDFPELGLVNIEVKIDSGAYTSAIHCEKITAFYEEGRALCKVYGV